MIDVLSVKNFRNLQIEHLPFDKGINFIIGQNGHGKTSILEALHFFSGALKTTKAAELLAWGASLGEVTVQIGDCNLRYVLMPEGKKSFIDGIEASTKGKLVFVTFTPDDLFAIKGEPSKRRRLVDANLGQILPLYAKNLRIYKHALAQRNNLLKLLQHTNETLDAWNEAILPTAVYIVNIRRRYISRLSEEAAAFYKDITGGEVMEIIYRPSSEDILQGWQATAARDIAAGFTIVGPHADDLDFLIKGREAKLYASQGQIRTAMLALKLAEMVILSKQFNPILLLDDVLSELDSFRQEYLLKNMPTIQSFITGTFIPRIQTNIIEIKEGRIL